ncbi:histidine kinase HAMP region domain protein [Halothece sp. PCC 7418]|uniref:Tll0287-like domain-containing protein n=1 Tax=Halothece sp. (strain PCC 7418) TaxID=65093 RepID=UPI0002A08589|nr:DUF3365 domain-containing protein [Halothece sp. PCC 7418]AFZ45365.1 histidine kinase HAMP region domain protein [Halothece sp. PCC 7418]
MFNFLDNLIGNLKLNSKIKTIFLLVMPIFLIGIIITGLALNQILTSSYKSEVTSKALLAMETMNSVREYTSNHVRPELVDRLKSEFLPETVPAYSATEVFKNLTANPNYQNFSYKEATVNPTNPRDQADEFETQLIQQFRRQQDVEELRGFRSSARTKSFYIAHPLKVSQASCLECHGNVSDAPQSLIDKYGTEGGFNWELGQIVGAQIVSVPADQIQQQTKQAIKVTMGFMLAFLATMVITVILVNLSLQRYVIRPIKKVARAAESISHKDFDLSLLRPVQSRLDELGHLAKVFQNMADQVYTREQQLEQKVTELKVKIDHNRKEKEVKEIVNTDFFKDLENRAQSLRKRHKKS